MGRPVSSSLLSGNGSVEDDCTTTASKVPFDALRCIPPLGIGGFELVPAPMMDTPPEAFPGVPEAPAPLPPFTPLLAKLVPLFAPLLAPLLAPAALAPLDCPLPD